MFNTYGVHPMLCPSYFGILLMEALSQRWGFHCLEGLALVLSSMDDLELARTIRISSSFDCPLNELHKTSFRSKGQSPQLVPCTSGRSLKKHTNSPAILVSPFQVCLYGISLEVPESPGPAKRNLERGLPSHL
jgi:hypothetical protein